MKKIIFFILILNCVSSKAQITYHNYLDCSSEWRYYVRGGWGGQFYVTKFFDGDSLINGNYYYRTKIMRRYFGNTQITTDPNYYIREDSSHNFIICRFSYPSGAYLRMDTLCRFDSLNKLQIGDTLIKVNPNIYLVGTYESYDPRNSVVKKIDTFYFGSKILKAIYPMDSNLTTTLKIYPCIIEGIGATYPLFNNTCCDKDMPYLYYYKKGADQIAFNSTPFKYSFDSFPSPVRVNVCSLLPLKLLSFNAKLQTPNNVFFNWQTTNEINVSHFNIQRSINAKNFTTVAKILAKNKSENEYQFIYNNLQLSTNSLNIYYRIESVDEDGKNNYSEVKNIEYKIINNEVHIYPNPAKSLVNIECTGAKEITITDCFGQIVKKQTINYQQPFINVQGLNKGLYIVYLTTNSEETKTGKLLVE